MSCFLVVIMASSIVRGRVRTTTTTTVAVLPKMVAIPQIIGSYDRRMQPWFAVYFFDV